MKKILAVFIVACMTFSLSACSLDIVKNLFNKNEAVFNSQPLTNVEKGIEGSNAKDFTAKLDKDFLFGSKNDSGTSKNASGTLTSAKDIPLNGVKIKYSVKYNAYSQVITAEFSAVNAGQLDDAVFLKGVRTYFGSCAAIPYQGADPVAAKAWVQKCIDDMSFKQGAKEKSWNRVKFAVSSIMSGSRISEMLLKVSMGTAKPEKETTIKEEITTEVNSKYIGIPGTKASDVLSLIGISAFNNEKKLVEKGVAYTSASAQKSLDPSGIDLSCSVEYDNDNKVISATVKVINNSFLYNDDSKLLVYAKDYLCRFAQLKFEKSHPANTKAWVYDCLFYESYIPDGKARVWSNVKFEINYSHVDGYVSEIWLTISKYESEK